MNTLSFVLRRAARHWQMLLTLGLGVLIATALLASSPVLVNTVVEFGLRRTILSGDPLTGNLQLRAFDRTDAAEFGQTNAQVQTAVLGRMGPYLDQIIPTIGARWLFPWSDDAVVPEERLIMRLYGSDADIQARATLVAGEWPDPAQTGAGNAFAAVIGEELAEAYGLAPGDELPLSPTRDAEAPTHTLIVSGIVRPANARDPFWFGDFSPLRAQSDERFTAQYSALVPESAFFPLAEALFPDVPYELTWNVLLDPALISTPDIPDLQAQLPLLSAELRGLSPAVTMDTNLGNVLASFDAQATSVRAPLYFLTAEVVLLALYYVVMVSSLAVRQVEREFAVLQSRGASGRQIFGLQATEALLVAGVAFLSGPVLGTVLVRALTTFGPLADVSEAGWPLTLPQLAWIAAAVGATACLIALLVPVGPAIRRSIVSYQQEAARSAAPPFWQRAYLDVILLLAGLVLLWRLQLYGGLVGGGTGGPEVDWLLLLSPVALLIGAGTILLRIFPLILNGLANLAARGRGLPGSLALWQAARNPTHVARLVLLLTLAIALGILTTGINATLDASEIERSQYASGSDVRLVANRSLSLSDVDSVPGVAAESATYRTEGSLTIGRSYLRFEALGIDPSSFGPLVTFRDDFASQPPAELLALLAMDPVEQPTIALPGRPAELSLWLWAAPDTEERQSFSAPQGASDLERVAIQVRVVSALGEILTANLEPAAPLDGVYPEDGWVRLSATLPALSESSYPLVLDSLTIRNRARSSGFVRQLPESMNLALDELGARDNNGAVVVLEDIEQQLAALPDVPGLTGGFSTDQTRSGAGSLSIQADFPPGAALVLSEQATAPPTMVAELPALASQRFLEQTGAAVGDTLNLTINSLPTTVRLVGAVRYFPTLYDDLNAGYLITNRDGLLARLNASANSAVNSNEAILAAAEDVAPEEVGAAAAVGVSGLSSVLEAEAIRRTIKADPMGLGLRSVTLFGYVLTAMLSLVGFATYFYFSARQRESMYGVLRSIGMSPSQLYVTLLLEQVILIVAGVTIGTLLGLLLNRITLPGLPITFGDRPPTPPFIARNDWAAVGQIYLTLAVAFFLALGAATLLLWRTNLHRALRVGEE